MMHRKLGSPHFTELPLFPVPGFYKESNSCESNHRAASYTDISTYSDESKKKAESALIKRKDSISCQAACIKENSSDNHCPINPDQEEAPRSTRKDRRASRATCIPDTA
eukprot:1151457-Pelagomonas_calceolata.AAC.6